MSEPRVQDKPPTRRSRLERGAQGGSGAGGPRLSGMDVRREPRGKRRQYALIAAAIAALVLITLVISRLQPAAPSVDRNVVVLGTVERGEMVREVRGSGILVPERVQYVAAVTAGRVESVNFEPGAEVSAEDVIVVLSNPDVELEVLQAEQQWTAAQAALVSLRQNLGTQRLSQEAAVASTRADYLEAQRESEAFSRLVEGQLVSENEYRSARERAEALATGLRTEEERLALVEATFEQQIAVQKEQVERLGAIYRYRKERAAAMRLKAGADGVLQDLDLEVGQWVQSGTTLARVAKPDRLKAELRVPQTQARDVQVGQSAVVDTRTDMISGRVRRVDPNVQGGTVLVEVTLDGELPAGARPDLSVDGTIQLERLRDVLHVGRPAYGQSNSLVSLFRLASDGETAERVTVQLGRSSVNRIEILDGLQEGDVIVLSDMSRYDDVDRVRIK